MRRLLNILAVMVGGLSLVLALGGAVMFVAAVVVYFKGSEPTGLLTNLSLMGIGAGLCFIGGLFASRALGHLRRPDARSASDLLTMAIYLLALGVIPLGKQLHAPGSTLLALVGLTFIWHYVRKQTARVFPPEGTTAQA